MSGSQEPQLDRKQIEVLARDSQLPVDEVVTLYEHELAELGQGARVTTYLHLFAIRNVQEILRRRRVGP